MGKLPVIVKEDTIDDIMKANSYRASTRNYQVEYEKLINYLKLQYDVDSEEEVLEYMNKRNIRFWSPLPNEQPASYKYFSYYLQLPVAHRTKSNVALLVLAYEENLSIQQAYDAYGGSDENKILNNPLYNRMRGDALFWEIRAKLYDDSMTEELMLAIQDTQLQRIAAMRNRSLAIAGLGSEVAIEMLTKAVTKLRELDTNDMRPSDIANFVKVAGTISTTSLGVAEQAMALTDLLSILDEQEEYEDEEERFIDAKII